MPPVHVSPALHLFIGWHEHPSDPAMQSVLSTVPEAPLGITHAPDLQTPLAQSGPVSQAVFGSGTDGMQSPPLHCPLRQSLACVQAEPAGDPETPPEPSPAAFSPPKLAPPVDVEPPTDVEPPMDVEPPSDIEPPVDMAVFPPALDPPEPPGEPLPCSLELQATTTPPARTNPESPKYARRRPLTMNASNRC